MDASRRIFLSRACAVASGAAWPLISQAQEPHLPPPQARQLESYFLRIYAQGLKRESFRANYPGDFPSWQARARPRLPRLIGLDAISQQTTSSR